MAQRRMFSLKIVDTDAFLDMPPTSQLLYFHLSMRADDDGFVANPKKVMRMIGVNDDDFKILIAKSFVIPFESGVCVIKHWKIHNYIQGDRYEETKWLDEKKSLSTKENGSYTKCIQNVSKMDTQVRLGKDRLGEVRIDKKMYGEFGRVILTDEEYQKLEEKIGIENRTMLITELDGYIQSKGKDPYKDHYATILNWTRKRIADHQKKVEAGKLRGKQVV